MSFAKYLKRGVQYILHGVPETKVVANVCTLAPSEMLAGRVALITGGTGGIGSEIARAFVNAGADVIVAGRSKGKLEECCRQICEATGTQGCVKVLEMDITDVAGLQARFEAALALAGNRPVSILVNNAGVAGGEIANCDEPTYDTIMDTNLKGAFFLTQVVGKYMKDNKIEGNILNVGSSSSLRPAASAYTISKWGVRGFTLGMAKALAPYGITVNAIAPGPTATPMVMPDGVKEDISFKKNPIGRYARPEEIANMAVFLVGPTGRTIVGDMVCMTGGAGLVTFDDITYSF